jgi:hypothetical protein
MSRQKSSTFCIGKSLINRAKIARWFHDEIRRKNPSLVALRPIMSTENQHNGFQELLLCDGSLGIHMLAKLNTDPSMMVMLEAGVTDIVRGQCIILLDITSIKRIVGCLEVQTKKPRSRLSRSFKIHTFKRG